MSGSLLAIAIVLLAAALIACAAQWIMDWRGVRPAEPTERPAGFAEVREKLASWLRTRRPPG